VLWISFNNASTPAKPSELDVSPTGKFLIALRGAITMPVGPNMLLITCRRLTGAPLAVNEQQIVHLAKYTLQKGVFQH